MQVQVGAALTMVQVLLLRTVTGTQAELGDMP
jgi:hypothetical protein